MFPIDAGSVISSSWRSVWMNLHKDQILVWAKWRHCRRHLSSAVSSQTLVCWLDNKRTLRCLSLSISARSCATSWVSAFAGSPKEELRTSLGCGIVLESWGLTVFFLTSHSLPRYLGCCRSPICCRCFLLTEAPVACCLKTNVMSDEVTTSHYDLVFQMLCLNRWEIEGCELTIRLILI